MTVRIARRMRAYLVPLHDDGKPAGGHVFGFARHGTDRRIHAELRQLVEGYGAPWRRPVRLKVNPRHGTVSVPADVLLAAALSRHRWFAAQTFERFLARHGIAHIGGGPWARWFRDPPEWSPGEGATWRAGRAVLVVDLDRHRISQAAALVWQALPWEIRPVTEHATLIEAGRAQEWNRDRGEFRTPEQTRVRWRAEGDAARGVLGRRSIHPRRWPHLRRELETRVVQDPRLGPTSIEQALRDEVRRGFEAIEMSQRVSRFLVDMAQRARRRPENPIDAVKRSFPSAFRALDREVRRALSAYLSAAISPGPRRHVEDPREVTATELETERPTSEEGKIGGTVIERASAPDAEQDFLDRIIAEEFAGRLVAELTLAQREVLEACMLGGEPAVHFARRRRRDPGTVRKQLFDVRQKAKELRRRDEPT